MKRYIKAFSDDFYDEDFDWEDWLDSDEAYELSVEFVEKLQKKLERRFPDGDVYEESSGYGNGAEDVWYITTEDGYTHEVTFRYMDEMLDLSTEGETVDSVVNKYYKEIISRLR